MSSEIAIKVENLSKCYQIYDQPRDRLKQFVLPRLQRFAGLSSKRYYREFWALKDVSFEIKKGETVGIIGRNGSGKSTLLQLICGTLSPTMGGVTTHGRIAALLELGSGFNPEFTGRENVYMNAAVLGLSREETEARFEKIITFADIGDFLEQPVKTYSSGMMVRLAFSVIVHVDADILIVDEALSVGDAFFTQKCMMRIKKLQQTGVTLLFVSHDTNAVKSLCSSAILLEHGIKVCEGETGKVVGSYYGMGVRQQQGATLFYETKSDDLKSDVLNGAPSQEQNAKFQKRAAFQRLQNGKAEFVNVQLLDEAGNQIEQIDFGQQAILRMTFRANEYLHSFGMAYHIRNKNGFDVVYSDTKIENCPLVDVKANEVYILDWRFNAALREGDYTIAAIISIPLDLTIGQVEVCDFVPLAAQVKVSRGNSLPIYGAVHWKNEVNMRHCPES